jgi:AcrR family transcriptional regulator
VILNEEDKCMNRQVPKTKNVIFDALLKKMNEKPYHEITIVEITEEADVARLSFYRHFNSKEDIILYKFKDIISKMVRKISVDTINAPKEILDLILSIVDGYKSIFKLIIKQNLYGLIVQSFSSDIRLLTKKITRLKDSDFHLLTFYEGALVNLIIDWISSESELSKDEYLNIVNNIFKKQLLFLNSN